MNRFSGKIVLLILVGLILPATDLKALPTNQFGEEDLPIIILAIDKVDSIELIESQHSSIRRFLEESACGVMSVRTGNGYTNTGSGFLTLGCGYRSVAPLLRGGAFKPEEPIMSSKSGSFWKWSTGSKPKKESLIVPEIGWIKNQVESENFSLHHGLLGEIFRSNGWKTYLYGDQDTFTDIGRPGGYALMDQAGIIDSGLVGLEINKVDHSFPYRYRFNSEEVLNQISRRIKLRNLILIEFGDFARLDRFREELLADQYIRLKGEIWEGLNHFLGEITRVLPTDQYRMLVVSPSLPRQGGNKRSMLAPIIVRGAGYNKGLLTSGTTNWEGLVANIDLLPTLINMAGLAPKGSFDGRIIRSIPCHNHLAKLGRLNDKISRMNSTQRSLLDWYLWIISTGWLAVTLSVLLKIRLGKGFLLIIISTFPLVMLIMPLFSMALWQELGLFLIAFILSLTLMRLKNTNQRYLLLSVGLWGGLILDQLTGWNLIRFSALGYSAVAGSRYYGIGNEYMGVFLAVTIVLAHLVTETIKCKWPALVMMGLSIIILGSPQLGINFGGTLAALVGFSFYLIKLYGLDWKTRRTLSAFSGIVMVIGLVGWWDSLRDPNLQTHIGRFFQLVFDLNLSQMWQIFSRKAAMNYKLIIYSAWTKIVLLAAVIVILNRLISKKLIDHREILVWEGLIITGFTAFLINDSGVVAFGTCLAYGFTYLLSRFEEREFKSSSYT